MGLGVLDDGAMKQVPGTTRYFDDPERLQYACEAHDGLKCDTSRPEPIILIPQPSDDPNDPLNWPLWKRDLITSIYSITAIFATALGPILAANTVTLTFWFGKPFSEVAELTGYFLLGCGVGSIIFVPSSRILGKRHAFVIGLVILVATSAWGGGSGKSYKSLLWARIFQGIGCAPYEALLNALVGDLYFVHQRGLRMALTNLAVFGGAFFTPILVGKITYTIRWWWTFYLVTIFSAVCLPLVIFFCPETAYRRDAHLNPNMPPKRLCKDDADDIEKRKDNSSQDPDVVASVDKHHAAGSATRPAQDPRPQGAAADVAPRVWPKKTFWQSVALFDGYKTDESFIKLLLRPFPLFLQPAFLWAALMQGLLIGWTVFIGVILAQFTLGAPLWWDEVQTGYAYSGAFLGAILGFVISGLMADSSARWMTRLNKGVYEPEFRLLLVVPVLILGCAGLFGWGITADGMLRSKYHVTVPLTFFGLTVAAMVVGAVASSLYILDAYRSLAIEGFTCLIIFKNIFGFALTFKAYAWLVENNTKATPLFNALGLVELVICLLSIPMYIFGKRIRSYFYRHDILALFGVR